MHNFAENHMPIIISYICVLVVEQLYVSNRFIELFQVQFLLSAVANFGRNGQVGFSDLIRLELLEASLVLMVLRLELVINGVF